MRSFLIHSLLACALAFSAVAQTPSGSRPAASVPTVTVTKPATGAAVPPDSDIRFPSGTTSTKGKPIDLLRNDGPRNAASRPGPAPAAPVGNGPGGTVFRPGDSFDLRMSGMPGEDAAAFPSPLTIGHDGFVNITYAGQIRAAGLTQSALERAIERRLIDEKIFRWPTATINSLNQQRTVTIGGNVRSPGRQVWSVDLTLLSAIASAGGVSDFGGDKVNVIRDGKITLYKIKLLKKNPADDPHLNPGDQVELL